MSRRPIIAGNWKMNMTRAQATELITALKPLVKDAAAEVVICVPYTDIDTAVALCKGSNIKVGAENVAWAEKGAFTGEISADMLLELGTEYVIIGHSERRQVLKTQVTGAFDGISAADAADVVIAYEPVWAIGTGKTATSEQAEETIAGIRAEVKALYGAEVAEGMRIQYGGSMNPKNVKELMAQPDIDGGLIGGASLKAVDFSQVVNYDA